MPEPWLPLSGIRAADFSMFVPGPFCTAILADLGAEVVKVESLNGDPGRGYVPVQFRTENRNKRSIALNLKNLESKKIVARLAKQSDIAIEGFRPGVAKRLGIDFENLQRANPKLIHCSISGYGRTGPWRERPGHEVNYVAAVAVLAALHERNRTGRGARLDLSLFEAAFFWAAMRHSLDPKVDPKAHLFPVHANGARGGQLRRGVPKTGEHSREILVELGFDDGEIAGLLKAGAVRS